MTKASDPPPLEDAIDDPVRQRRAQRIHRLAELLDDAFRIPGTNWRVGWDSIIGLIPGGGDVATGLLAAYIVAEAARLGIPRKTLARMLVNLTIDVATGIVPVAGDLVDAAYKANRRNVKLLEEHLARSPEKRRE